MPVDRTPLIDRGEIDRLIAMAKTERQASIRAYAGLMFGEAGVLSALSLTAILLLGRF